MTLIKSPSQRQVEQSSKLLTSNLLPFHPAANVFRPPDTAADFVGIRGAPAMTISDAERCAALRRFHKSFPARTEQMLLLAASFANEPAT